jgi:Ca-activated chloride channel family protein
MTLFLSPQTLILLIIVPILALFLLWRGFVRTNTLRKIGDENLVARLTAQISPARRRLKSLLWLITVGLLVMAWARPVWGTELQVIQPLGAEIIFLVDVSRSMDAQDITPSRLERAKLDLQILLETLDGNHFAVMLFAAQTVPFMPFTFDTVIAQTFLQNINTNAITQQGTAIADALTFSATLFDNDPQTPAFIVLVSDGENHEGDLQSAITTLQNAQIRVFTVGYGTLAGAPIPLYDASNTITGFKTDTSGTIIVSRLDETALTQIANATQGAYFLPNGTIIELANAINQTEDGTLQTQVVPRPIEQFSWFVLFALIALSIEIILPETRRD